MDLEKNRLMFLVGVVIMNIVGGLYLRCSPAKRKKQRFLPGFAQWSSGKTPVSHAGNYGSIPYCAIKVMELI